MMQLPLTIFVAGIVGELKLVYEPKNTSLKILLSSVIYRSFCIFFMTISNGKQIKSPNVSPNTKNPEQIKTTTTTNYCVVLILRLALFIYLFVFVFDVFCCSCCCRCRRRCCCCCCCWWSLLNFISCYLQHVSIYDSYTLQLMCVFMI